jgi:hypothetical protein
MAAEAAAAAIRTAEKLFALAEGVRLSMWTERPLEPVG